MYSCSPMIHSEFSSPVPIILAGLGALLPGSVTQTSTPRKSKSLEIIHVSILSQTVATCVHSWLESIRKYQEALKWISGLKTYPCPLPVTAVLLPPADQDQLPLSMWGFFFLTTSHWSQGIQNSIVAAITFSSPAVLLWPLARTCSF